jgi:plasmid stabilization system protein ParE
VAQPGFRLGERAPESLASKNLDAVVAAAGAIRSAVENLAAHPLIGRRVAPSAVTARRSVGGGSLRGHTSISRRSDHPPHIFPSRS